MCDRIILLAQLDHRRWISCCEHGTSHLTWDNLSIRIPLQKLVALNQTLQECALIACRYRIASSGEVCVIFDQFDLCQLWLGGVGLCLTPIDFQLFCQLLDQAGDHPMATSGHDEPAIPMVESPVRTAYHLFSLN